MALFDSEVSSLDNFSVALELVLIFHYHSSRIDLCSAIDIL
jgi:hypothetical protein